MNINGVDMMTILTTDQIDNLLAELDHINRRLRIRNNPDLVTRAWEILDIIEENNQKIEKTRLYIV